MAAPSVKTSFASGEWSPKLRSRVDVQKYHSGAALLRNFYVDYSGGGASTRQGTKFVNQGKTSATRIIPFQPSTTLSYVLEFGQNYIRFYSNGAPIVEASTTISGITNANPGVITDVAHGYLTGDWVFLNSILGTTQLNGNYYIVVRIGANTYSLTDLNGNAIDTTGFGVYVSGGTAQRVYTITSPYLANDLLPNPSTGNPGLKWVQNVTSIILTHPSYQPAVLTINAPADWTLANIAFGSTVQAPATPTITSTSGTGAGWNYAYIVTAVDINGQESAPSAPGGISNLSYNGSTEMTNKIDWVAIPGAQSYNVYKALPVKTTAIPGGSLYGFIGNVTGTDMLDAFPGIVADFSQTPPVVENPFLGAGVQSYTVTAGGAYAGGAAVPTIVVAAPGTGSQATAVPSMGVSVVGAITHATTNEDIVTTGADPNGSNLTFADGVVLRITNTTLAGGSPPFVTWRVNNVTLTNPGSVTVGTLPTSPAPPSSCSVSGFVQFNGAGGAFGVTFTWAVMKVLGVSAGAGYTSAPAVTFSSGAATATATLAPGGGGGNPGVPGFIQERLMLSAQIQSVQSFNLSQPGSFYNFNTSNPVQDDDAISGTIVSEELNDIRSTTPVPTGIMALTGRGGWLINGGGGISTQVPITPINATAQPQAFNGANDLRPLKVGMDLLYGTNKGNYVRDLSYNLYAQIFTGADISVLSNHLFFGYFIYDWCWAEEPFKTLWAVRNDGQALSLGYVKEQELIGWAHHDTNGQFKSTCSVIETVGNGNIVDAVYFIVQRGINGNYVSYIERMADRFFPYGYEDSWSVDCALQTSPVFTISTTLFVNGDASVVGNLVVLLDGISTPFTAPMAAGNWIVRVNGGIYKITAFTNSGQVTAQVVQVCSVINLYTGNPYPAIGGYTIWTPISTVSGLTQLIGQNVFGVADGAAIGPFTVSVSGTVALGLTATKVTLGLVYTPQLQTLPLDLGEPTVQGKRKKIVALTLRVADTLGLSVGKTFQTLVAMKDFLIGNVPTTSTGVALIGGLVNGDGRTILDQEWDTAGNYCVQQNLPYPATILGVMPETIVGDGK